MPTKDLFVLCDGTGDSPEADSATTAPDNVQILRDMLSANLKGRRSSARNFEQGWEIDQFQYADTPRFTYYLRGLGAPQLDANGKVIAWKWSPRSFFQDAEIVYRKFQGDQDEFLATGIIDRVAMAYRFIAQYYTPGDRIFLFGFSRGSYTLHVLINVINYIGLLDVSKFSNSAALEAAIEKAFNLYNLNLPPDDPSNPIIAFKAENCLPPDQYIHFYGAWDCVPGFVDVNVHESSKLSDIVRTARHAVAINEYRAAYDAQIWNANPEKTDSLQMWFRGDHSDIGGSYPDHRLANLALHWLIDEAIKCGLYIDPMVLNAPEYAPVYDAPQHDSYNEAAITPTSPDLKPVLWSDLFYKYRRLVAQKYSDERVHRTAREMLGKKVVVIDAANNSHTIDWLPANLMHLFLGAGNVLSSEGGAPMLTGFSRLRSLSDEYAESQKLLKPGEDTQDNDVTAAKSFKWCPCFSS